MITITLGTAGTAANGKTVTITEDGGDHRHRRADGLGRRQRQHHRVGQYATARSRQTSTAIASAIDGLADYSAIVERHFRRLATTCRGRRHAPAVAATLRAASTAAAVSPADLVFELAGATGSEVFNFEAGASISELVDADQPGAATPRASSATVNGTTLELTSTAYGSDAFVDLSDHQ